MSGLFGELDDTVHQRYRLGILTVLDGAERADFTFLRDTVGMSDGNLSRNLGVLEQVGYLTLEKRFEGRRPRTWVRITSQGRSALAAEVRALKEIVATVERSSADRRRPRPRTVETR